MSFHQFYDFRAIDNFLSAAQLDEVRRISNHATVCASRFSVAYDYGDLRGSPADLMDKYFDAHYYVSSNSKQLTFKLPTGCVPIQTVQAYLADGRFAVEERESGLHLAWVCEDESDGWVDDTDEAADFDDLLAARNALINSDLRPLYIAWLAGIEDLDDQQPEPPVPAGLGADDDPSGPLADWLGVSEDLLAAAAEASAPPANAVTESDALKWLTNLPICDRDRALAAVLGVADRQRMLDLQRQWCQWLASRNVMKKQMSSRTVADLRRRTEVLAQERQDREIKEKAVKRAAHLGHVHKSSNAIWKQIAFLVDDRSRSAPQQIVSYLNDLQDAADIHGTRMEFDARLTALAAPLSPTRVLWRHLRDAGLVKC